MRLKLFFKQSIKDFIVYWPLYLTFTLFLIIGISLSLGLTSFGSLFTNDLKNSIGLKLDKNAKFTPEKYLVGPPQEHSSELENLFAQQEPATLPIYNFFLETIEYTNNKNVTNQNKKFDISKVPQDIIKTIYKYFAYHEGNIIHIKDDIETIPYLNSSLNEAEIDYDQLNKYVDYIQFMFKYKYKSANVQSAFIIKKYVEQNAKLGEGLPKFNIPIYRDQRFSIKFENIEQKVTLETFLSTKNMGDLYQGYYGDILADELNISGEIPNTSNHDAKILNYRFFQSDEFNKINYVNWINFKNKKFSHYIDKTKPEFGMFFYLQPRTANWLNLELGKKYKIGVLTNNSQINYELLYAGTFLNKDLAWNKKTFNFYSPIQTINKILYESNKDETEFTEFGKYWLSSKPIFYNSLYLYLANIDNVAEGQEFFSNWFEKNMLSPIKSDHKLQSSVAWADTDLNMLKRTMWKMSIIVSAIIILFVFALLFLTFFFISQQIILLKQKHLFFLKSLGVNNFELSILNTFALLTPILVGFGLSIFGALIIQNAIINISFSYLNFYHGFWTIDNTFIIAFMGLFIAGFIGFFIINFFIINSKILRISGMGVAKNISKMQMKLKSMVYKFNSRTRIGLAFTFKNIYKNIISYIMLTISFSIIFFSFQFSNSLTAFSTSYEKWNEPYKSIKLNTTLPLYNLIENNGEKEVIPAYETIDISELNEMIKLDDAFWNKPSEILKVLTTQMHNAYIPKQTVSNFLNRLINDPAYYEKIKKIIESIFPKNSVDKPHMNADSIMKLINRFILLKIENPLFDGMNIMFGKVVGSYKKPSIESGKQMGVYVNGWDDKLLNIRTNLLAFENDEYSQNHFDYGFEKYGLIERTSFNNQKLDSKNKWAINANVSNTYAKRTKLNIGDEFVINTNNLGPITLRLNKIMHNDTIFDSYIYVPQLSLFEYLAKTNSDNPPLQEFYEKIVLDIKKQKYVSNSYFSTQMLPMQLEYFTLPVLNKTGVDAGSSIFDYYKKNLFEDYLNSINQGIMIFNLETRRLDTLMTSLTGTMRISIIASISIAMMVSIILTILILLENKKTILMFKTIGYKKREINLYLISGYLVSITLGVFTAILLAWITLEKVVAEIMKTLWFDIPLNFGWGLGFIGIVIASILLFFILINSAISYFTKIQQPKYAFVDL
ncbi:FtsX-like permease family protein [Williamsoniiplasma luminosum]|uniref:ABC transporter permease n=1 Tax=Williamsoniiplasma luminosum TaxID=214888 RepID=A0A2S0NKS1_9MOLU|nr:FtsX-like permease family protein [Williamsoniiplasma luminosum]AVP49602.1 MAG: hypothetical protein C5T88_03445 [Williamsoniiplasma luminosum]